MIANDWKKSSYSQGGSANCLECRTDQNRVLIRDTQHRHLGHLEVLATEWRAFLTAIRTEEL